jgi:hypothetical protein
VRHVVVIGHVLRRQGVKIFTRGSTTHRRFVEFVFLKARFLHENRPDSGVCAQAPVLAPRAVDPDQIGVPTSVPHILHVFCVRPEGGRVNRQTREALKQRQLGFRGTRREFFFAQRPRGAERGVLNVRGGSRLNQNTHSLGPPHGKRAPSSLRARPHGRLLQLHVCVVNHS